MTSHSQDALHIARQVLETEADAIRGLIPQLNESFVHAVDLLHACQGRVIVTIDADYVELHRRSQDHCGIGFFPGGRRRSVGEMVESLRLIHAVYTAEEMVGRLEYL